LDSDEVTIHESFLGFVSMDSGTAEYIAEAAIKVLTDLEIDIQKLRGQVCYIINRFLPELNCNE